MYNPFKFGSVVEGSFFTNRKDELNFVTKTLASNNHLVIISPRRFGKTSLIKKVISETDRKAIYLDVQLTNTAQDFAAQLLRRIYRVWPGEKLRQPVSRFRMVPAIYDHTDKQTMTFMALRKDSNDSPLSHGSEIGPSSTVYSSLKRLMLNSCVIKTDAGYELDDPFFKRWIVERRNQ